MRRQIKEGHTARTVQHAHLSLSLVNISIYLSIYLSIHLISFLPANHKFPDAAAIRWVVADGPGEGRRLGRLWSKVPGLRSKYFTMNPAGSVCTGFYCFFTKGALTEYLESVR